MAYKQYSLIRVRPIVYDRDTNGDFVLNTNEDKIVLVQPENVNPAESYDYLVEINESFN
jgi:hypothetical protein